MEVGKKNFLMLNLLKLGATEMPIEDSSVDVILSLMELEMVERQNPFDESRVLKKMD